VRGIVVEAEELGPLGGRQLNLLPGEDGRAPSPERLLAAERALARIQARWGEGAVRQAELVASRRPERAFHWRVGKLTLQDASTANGKSASGSLSRAVRTPRPSVRAPVRKRSEPASPKRPLGTRPVAARPVATMDARSLWLRGPMEEVQVDRGCRLPNGRRRSGTVTQGDRVRRVIQAAGPWRLVERWAPEPISRDAYHVVLSDGTACWLIHDRLDGPEGRWRILATFD
jgi:hypothetical protein